MFIGEYRHNLDAKGRLSVPAKFRSQLGSAAILTKGLESCLFLYPKEQWNVMAEKIASLPISSANARAFSRLMLNGAMEVEIDRLGRILIPAYLREYAALRGETVVTGVYNRAEIWDQETWQRYTSSAETNSTEIVEQLKEWGI